MKPNSFACGHNARSRDPQERATGILAASTMLAPGDSKRPSRASNHHWRESHRGERRQYLLQRSGFLYYSPAVNVNSSGLS
ncbi:hypothetical protein QQF64_000750 [Cirrhinus molitorella]|uniref:Uncharacterized protein n=1 Tax=Cirrhinus molitorella TaxID=172907 RepID=A0ABR3NYM0_9TELE